MFMQNIKVIVLMFAMVVCTFPASAQVAPWRMVHGEVVQVFPEQHKILLEHAGQKEIFQLVEDCQILREGSPVTLSSLRPIAPGAFQDALLWLDHRGEVNLVLANYRVQEEHGVLVNYDIFGNLK